MDDRQPANSTNRDRGQGRAGAGAAGTLYLRGQLTRLAPRYGWRHLDTNRGSRSEVAMEAGEFIGKGKRERKCLPPPWQCHTNCIEADPVLHAPGR